jgi:hypothetical protein
MRDAEIHHRDSAAVFNHDVLRLEIPMHDALRMSRG